MLEERLSNTAEPSWRGLGTAACMGSGQSTDPRLKTVSPTPCLHSSHPKGSKREHLGVACLYITLGVQSSPPMPASPRGSRSWPGNQSDHFAYFPSLDRGWGEPGSASPRLPNTEWVCPEGWRQSDASARATGSLGPLPRHEKQRFSTPFSTFVASPLTASAKRFLAQCLLRTCRSSAAPALIIVGMGH